MKKVLMLSIDQNIFREGAEVRNRVIEYGRLFEELHIVVYTDAKNVNQSRMTRISNNVWIYPTNTKWKLFYFWDAYRIFKSILRTSDVLKNVRRPKEWVVSAQDPFETGLMGYFLKKKFNLPLQIQVHTDFLSPYFWKESLKNKIRVLLAKWLLPGADKIRVVSERIKNSLVSNVRCQMSDVNVLPIFVDVEAIKNAPIKTDLHKKYPNNDFIILMASRLTREKNIDLAIEAIKEVIKTHPKTLLLIVGAGPEFNKLNVKCQMLNVASNVIFESWTKDLASYYKTADLFLLTSNYEGYGRTIVEAAAGGLSAIMTDVGLAGEFLKNSVNGLIIPINNKNELINAIDDMIKNRDKLKEFSKNTEKTVRQLTTKEEYFKKYEEIL